MDFTIPLPQVRIRDLPIAADRETDQPLHWTLVTHELCGYQGPIKFFSNPELEPDSKGRGVMVATDYQRGLLAFWINAYISLENTGVDLSGGAEDRWFPNRVPHLGQGIRIISTRFGTCIPFFLPFMGQNYTPLCARSSALGHTSRDWVSDPDSDIEDSFPRFRAVVYFLSSLLVWVVSVHFLAIPNRVPLSCWQSCQQAATEDVVCRPTE